LLFLAISALLVSASCAGAAEQSVLSQFFSASRLLDLTSLSNVATVLFDPRTDGIVVSFTVQAITVTKQDGPMVSEDVTVRAPVRLPAGQTVDETLVFTLQRAISSVDTKIPGNWVITGFRRGD
jgi:hypothetical protein